MFGNLASDWGLYTILICLPMFLLDILHFDIQTVGYFYRHTESSYRDGGFNAVLKTALKPSHPYNYFSPNGQLVDGKLYDPKHFPKNDLSTGGGRAGPGGDCFAIGEAPSKQNVGSFTKRSEVRRRATFAN